MIALGIISGVGVMYVTLFLYALTGPGARFTAAISGLAVNYGVRRFLFYDLALGQSEIAWYVLILVGDLFVGLIMVIGLIEAPRPFSWARADCYVGLLIIFTVFLACVDERVSVIVRFAHWKEEYGCLFLYVLARQCGKDAGRCVGLLLSLSIVAVFWSIRQIVWGPSALDIAWIESGRSVLAQEGIVEVVGAHGLGNLEAGWLRPYAFFGNGTDMGVFMAFVWALASACHSFGVSWKRRFSLLFLCAFGSFSTMVRFTWVVFLGTVVGQIFMWLPSSLWRWGIFICTGLSLGGAALWIGSITSQGEHVGSLLDRVFFTGTYIQRVHAQTAWFQNMAEKPVHLFIGKGFGANGAAHAKFSGPIEGDEDSPPYHHSRALDLVEDGGCFLLILVALTLWTGLRSVKHSDVLSCRMASFVGSLVIVSVFLGGKSVLLGALLWGSLGVVVNRRKVV